MIAFSAPQRPDPKISQRAENIVIYSVFCSYQERNSAICDVFSSSSLKIEPKTLVFTMFSQQPKKASVAKTPLFATLWQHNMSEMLYFTVFQKHGYLQCFVKTHARNTVNTNEFKDYTFHGNRPQKAKTVIFTAFLRNDFSKKKGSFWTIFGF